jgi:hypothetical protein
MADDGQHAAIVPLAWKVDIRRFLRPFVELPAANYRLCGMTAGTMHADDFNCRSFKRRAKPNLRWTIHFV